MGLVAWFDETDLNTNGSLCLGSVFFLLSLGPRLCIGSPRTAQAFFLGFTILGQEQGTADKADLLGQVHKRFYTWMSNFPKCLVLSLLLIVCCQA